MIVELSHGELTVVINVEIISLLLLGNVLAEAKSGVAVNRRAEVDDNLSKHGSWANSLLQHRLGQSIGSKLVQ